MNDRDDMLDEAALRRALRFDPGEPRPHFDPRMIAAVARQAPTRRVAVFALAASFVTGLVAATVWSAALGVAPTIADGVVSTVIPIAIVVASVVVPIAQLAADPVVPASLLAALGVAIVYELRERRERAHVHNAS